MATSTMPSRPQGTSAEKAYDGQDEDVTEVTKLFTSRIAAWSQVTDYLEDYVKTTEKIEHSHAKEYEKVLKTVNSPLKEGQQFDQSVGGITGMLDNIKTNTTSLHQSHNETAKAIDQTVLPVFKRLSGDLKSKGKEVSKSAGKGGKAVDKARATTQKHIERLGTNTAAFESSTGKVTANDDPYVLQRGIYHRLNAQVQEENNNREDLINIQNEFSRFEAHIVTQIQQGMAQFDKIMAAQADKSRVLYGEMNTHTSRIAPDFEWNGFINRNRQVLIDPREPPRQVESIGFANQNHAATQAVIAGSLERKSKVLKKYEAGFYAVTPSKFLHEFKTNDNFSKDPVPENSLYLPDCMIGALDGAKFAVKGKDASKGTIGSKLSLSHEYQFQAHTPQEAQKWYEAIRAVIGSSDSEMPESGSEPGSANTSRVGTGNLETAGVGGAGVGGASAAPHSAGPASSTEAPVAPATTTSAGHTDATPLETGLGGHPNAAHAAPGSAISTSGAQAVPSGAGTNAPSSTIPLQNNRV